MHATVEGSEIDQVGKCQDVPMYWMKNEYERDCGKSANVVENVHLALQAAQGGLWGHGNSGQTPLV